MKLWEAAARGRSRDASHFPVSMHQQVYGGLEAYFKHSSEPEVVCIDTNKSIGPERVNCVGASDSLDRVYPSHAL